MAIIQDRLLPDGLRGALQSLGPKGVGVSEWERAQQEKERYKTEIQRAMLQLQGEAQRQGFEREDQEMRRAQAKSQQLSAERGIVGQDIQNKTAQAKLDAAQEDRATDKSERTAMAGSASPFEAVLMDPSLSEPVRTQLTRDQAIFSKLSTPEYRQQFAKDSLGAARGAIQEEQRGKLKSGIQDRLARGDYGEDEAVHQAATGMAELLEKGADPSEVDQQDRQLRAGVAKGIKEKMAKERLGTFIATKMASLPPESPEADQLETILAAYQSGGIPNEKVMDAVNKALAPKNEQQGPSPMEMRKQAHAMAIEEARALGITDPKALREIYEGHLAELMPQEQGSSDAGMGKAWSMQTPRPGQAGEAGRGAPGMFPAGSPAAPAPPEKTAASVKQAQGLAEVDEKKFQSAKQAAVAALKAGDKAKAEKILADAGLDRDAPEPKMAQRAVKRGGRDDF